MNTTSPTARIRYRDLRTGMVTRDGRTVVAVAPASARHFISVTFDRGEYARGSRTEDIHGATAVYVTADSYAANRD